MSILIILCSLIASNALNASNFSNKPTSSETLDIPKPNPLPDLLKSLIEFRLIDLFKNENTKIYGSSMIVYTYRKTKQVKYVQITLDNGEKVFFEPSGQYEWKKLDKEPSGLGFKFPIQFSGFEKELEANQKTGQFYAVQNGDTYQLQALTNVQVYRDVIFGEIKGCTVVRAKALSNLLAYYVNSGDKTVHTIKTDEELIKPLEGAKSERETIIYLLGTKELTKLASRELPDSLWMILGPKPIVSDPKPIIEPEVVKPSITSPSPVSDSTTTDVPPVPVTPVDKPAKIEMSPIEFGMYNLIKEDKRKEWFDEWLRIKNILPALGITDPFIPLIQPGKTAFIRFTQKDVEEYNFKQNPEEQKKWLNEWLAKKLPTTVTSPVVIAAPAPIR